MNKIPIISPTIGLASKGLPWNIEPRKGKKISLKHKCTNYEPKICIFASVNKENYKQQLLIDETKCVWKMLLT